MTIANLEVKKEVRHQPRASADHLKAYVQGADLSYKRGMGRGKLVVGKIKKYSIKGRAEGRSMLCCSTDVGVVPPTPLEA